MIKAVLFDFIGTTVKETDPEAINKCFEKAFNDNAVPVDRSLLKKNRGKDKRTIIDGILRDQELPLSLVHNIYASFKMNVIASIDSFSENEGTKEIFSYLQKNNIKTGIGTGLERDLFDKICDHLKWDKFYFDYTGTASEIGRGRPYPDMLLDMMRAINISDTKVILKVGDTIADIQEGKNANVETAVLLSGTQNANDLLKENPDFVIKSLTDLITIIEKNQLPV